MSVMDRETQRLKLLCEQAEDDLKQDLSEEGKGQGHTLVRVKVKVRVNVKVILMSESM